MAGFEIVVRPVVFPNIRPAPAQPLSPADDPERGFAVIHGNGGKQIDLTFSWSGSASSSQRTEIKRRVDEVRVYQKKSNGKVNKKNYVDLDVVNKIWMKGAPAQNSGNRPSFGFDQGPMEEGAMDRPDAIGPEKNVYYYRRIREQSNIEIRRRDVIKNGGDS